MHEVLVNRLGGLSLPRKSVVRLTDRPDMTLDVYRGRKTTMQHATDEEICKKVRNLGCSDRRIKVKEIAQALGISHGSVSTTLHDRSGMRKLRARRVPKSLSDEQTATRASVCSILLKRFRSKDDFLLRLV